MKNILIPTDFSENSRTAIQFAMELFGSNYVSYHIINAYFPPVSGPETSIAVHTMLKDNSEKSMELLVTAITTDQRFESYDIKYASVYGDLEYVLDKQIRSRKIDLVVMGTGGASGVKELFVGSKTSAILKRINIPMIVVPSGTKYTGLRQMLLAVDNKAELKSLENLMRDIPCVERSGLNVLLLNESSVGDLGADKIGLNEILPNANFIDLSGSYSELSELEMIINEVVNAKKVDMIMMVKHKRGFWDSIFSESKTQQICMHTTTPLLVVNEELELVN